MSCFHSVDNLWINYNSLSVRDSGVYVIEIDPDSPAARDGRLRVDDRIDSINGVNLIDIPNNK